jgi:hypothetical protein
MKLKSVIGALLLNSCVAQPAFADPCVDRSIADGDTEQVVALKLANALEEILPPDNYLKGKVYILTQQPGPYRSSMLLGIAQSYPALIPMCEDLKQAMRDRDQRNNSCDRSEELR